MFFLSLAFVAQLFDGACQSCDDKEIASQEGNLSVRRVHLDNDHCLVLCGYRSDRGSLQEKVEGYELYAGFQILEIKNAEKSSVTIDFEGEIYLHWIKVEPEKFAIQQALPYSPYIRRFRLMREVKCEKNCVATEFKCIRDHADAPVSNPKALTMLNKKIAEGGIGKGPPYADTLVDQIFELALSGHKEAQEFFERSSEELKLDGSYALAFTISKTSLERALGAGCFE